MSVQKGSEAGWSVTSRSSSPATGSPSPSAEPKYRPSGAVLEEEVYEEGLKRIIERDFFPALPILRAQNEYLEALKNNDLHKLKEITLKMAQKTASSSSKVGTPNPWGGSVSERTASDAGGGGGGGGGILLGGEAEEDSSLLTTIDHKPVNTNQSLDSFQSKYISEDDASFETLVNRLNQEKRQKYKWLYDQGSKQLLLTDGTEGSKPERKLLQPSTGDNHYETWAYTPKNTLMFNPDGAPLTAKEIIERSTSKQAINHAAVSFTTKPEVTSESPLLGKSDKSDTVWKTLDAEPLQLLRQLQDQEKPHLTPSAKVVTASSSTPQVGGWGFVPATPNLVPGPDASPFMTWGELEGTPLLLDPSATPSRSGGPTFKLPETTPREKIAQKLTEDASKSYRHKTKIARLSQTAARLKSPAAGSASPFLRDRMLSPAAQKLLKSQSGSKLGHSGDYQLRASYSSPKVGRPGTAASTPSSKSISTPSLSEIRTPQLSSSRPSSTTTTTTASSSSSTAPASSLTDNLLDF